MIIWFVFMLFYCFGRRKPTSDMGVVAAFAGGAELIFDGAAVLSLIS